MFSMPDITTSILSLATSPSAYPGVGLGKTTMPYLAHRFESGHIPPSTPFVEYIHSLLPVLTPLLILTGVVVDT